MLINSLTKLKTVIPVKMEVCFTHTAHFLHNRPFAFAEMTYIQNNKKKIRAND